MVKASEGGGGKGIRKVEMKRVYFLYEQAANEILVLLSLSWSWPVKLDI